MVEISKNNGDLLWLLYLSTCTRIIVLQWCNVYFGKNIVLCPYLLSDLKRKQNNKNNKK